MKKRSGRGTVFFVIAMVASSALGISVASAHQPSSRQSAHAQVGTTLPGTRCPAFPADNVWNTPITSLPVDADSATWLASMDSSSTDLHPDYGPSGNPRQPYGIPWIIVPARTKFTWTRRYFCSP